eukprot:m.175253 g.175253  ORF g.175253 m.175253 type:complete len:461 (+) comp17916_c1_seq5:250-1632(+)
MSEGLLQPLVGDSDVNGEGSLSDCGSDGGGGQTGDARLRSTPMSSAARPVSTASFAATMLSANGSSHRSASAISTASLRREKPHNKNQFWRPWLLPTIVWDGPHVKEYNTQKLIRWKFFILEGTVFDFARRFPWVQLFLLYIVAGLVAAYASQASREEQDTAGWWSHLNYASSTINTLVIFLLGFATSVVNQRWWDMRMAVGAIQRNVATFTVLCTTYLRGGEEQRKIRDQLIRYANLSHSLGYRMASRRTQNLGDLVQRGLVADDAELDALNTCPQPVMLVSSWISALLVDAVANNLMLLPEHGLPLCQRYVLDMATNTRIVLDYLESQLPFPYVHLMTVLVKSALLVLAADAGQRIGFSYATGEYGWIAAEAFIILLINFLYQGLLHLQGVLENPFLNHAAHFPRHAFEETLQRNTFGTNHCAETLPFELASKPTADDETTSTLRHRVFPAHVTSSVV